MNVFETYYIAKNCRQIREVLDVLALVQLTRLYDIIGKKLNTPVYNLIGGKTRDRIRTYAGLVWYSRSVYLKTGVTIERIADDATNIAKMGYDAMKLGPWSIYQPEKNEYLNEGAELVRAVQEAIGDKVDLLIDCYRNFTPRGAIKAAQMIEEYNPFYFEEPVASDNLNVMARITAKTNIPTVTGEMLYTIWDFQEALEKQATDIINPDLAATGGITEKKKIAAMAEAHKIDVSPHSVMGPVAQAATAHFATATQNCILMEDWQVPGTSFRKLADEVSPTEWVKPKNGYIAVPDKPGLGIEVNEDSILDEEDLAKFREENMKPSAWQKAKEHFYWRTSS